MANTNSLHVLQNKCYVKHILDLSKLFSRTPLDMVCHGDRDTTTIHVQKSKLNDRISTLKKSGLFYTHLYWSKKNEGFSHVLRTSQGSSPNDISYGVVTQTEKIGREFKQNLLNNNDTMIGEFLGFPECCTSFYEKYWNSRNFDLIWEQALNSNSQTQELVVDNRTVGTHKIIKGIPECLSIYRYWGPRLCFHIPCSLNCEQSKQVGLKHLSYLTLHTSQESARDYQQFFYQEANWYTKNGVSITRNSYLKGISHYPKYKKMLSIHFEPTL